MRAWQSELKIKGLEKHVVELRTENDRLAGGAEVHAVADHVSEVAE